MRETRTITFEGSEVITIVRQNDSFRYRAPHIQEQDNVFEFAEEAKIRGSYVFRFLVAVKKGVVDFNELEDGVTLTRDDVLEMYHG